MGRMPRRRAWAALAIASLALAPAAAQEATPIAELDVLSEAVTIHDAAGAAARIAASEAGGPHPLGLGDVVLVELGGRAEARLAGCRVLLGESVSFEARGVEGDRAAVRLLGVDLELERVTVIEATFGSLLVELVEGKVRFLRGAVPVEVGLTAGALRGQLRLAAGQEARAAREPGADALQLTGEGALVVTQPDGATLDVALPATLTWGPGGVVTVERAPLLPTTPPELPDEAPAAPAPQQAAGDDPFPAARAGLRLGFSLRPDLDLEARIGGRGGAGPTADPTAVDVPQDLGVHESRYTEFLIDFDRQVILDLEGFVESRWVNASLWWVTPYAYRGETALSRTIQFGGEEFLATSRVAATFRQVSFGAEVAVNVVNNELLRVAPTFGLRAFGFDWRVEDSLASIDPTAPRADSSDVDVPFSLAGYEVLPHPEVGIELRIGRRRTFEVGLDLAAATIDAYGVKGRTLRGDLTATVFPLDTVGIQLGGRWSVVDLESASTDPRDRFEVRLEQMGATASVLVRFG